MSARRINAYDRALMRLGERLMAMSEAVGGRLSAALSALAELDAAAAGRVAGGDDEIDALDEALEMDALDLISLQQPVDSDLRFLAATMRISRDLERIGDYACDIAEVAAALAGAEPRSAPPADVPRMGRLVQAMMEKSLKAHMDGDLEAAWQLHGDDDEVDRLFIALSAELTERMKTDPGYIDQASNLLLVNRYLERVGDHVVNISEMTIFAATGERHPFKTRKAGMQR